MPRRYLRVLGDHVGSGVFRGESHQWGNGVFRGQPYQWGTGYPPYRNFQEGEGIGDIFRTVMRFLLPIVTPIAAQTASKFIGSTAQAMKEGHSIGSAAKRSIAPALGVALEGATSKIMEGVTKATQGGTGRKRKRRRTSGARKRVKRRRVATAQTGGRRKRRKTARRKKQTGTGKRKGVYKRRRRVRKFRPTQFLNSNF